VWLLNSHFEGPEISDSPGYRGEWMLAISFVQFNGESTFTWMSIARVAAIVFPILGTVLIWRISKRLSTTWTAICATTLWVFSPTVLTFGAAITPDVCAAAFGLLAAWRNYLWLRLPTVRNSVLMGMSLGFTLLSKFTWIMLPPLLIVLFVAECTRCRCSAKRWTRLVRQLLLAGLVSIFIVNLGYEFTGFGWKLSDFTFCSRALSGVEGLTGNRFLDSWVGEIRLPIPKDYVLGIDLQKRDFEGRFQSYFLGEWRESGWWYYYIVGVWLKEPIALTALLLFGTFQLVVRVKNNGVQLDNCWAWFLVSIPGVVLFVFVSSQTGFNHHVRYVLPALPCLYMGVGTLATLSSQSRNKWVVIVLLAWYCASSVAVLPRSYSFFNEAVGGPAAGIKYLNNSNLDWGQDLLTIRKWINENPDRRPVYLVYSVGLIDDFEVLGIDAINGRPYLSEFGPMKEGWWVVFNELQLHEKGRWFRGKKGVRLSASTSAYLVQ
ncbi:MAG: glycosyltransferase family 39 protein, partial [Pirellulaceae bacterium]|nr:glycosyltransferase family 39 protein [Pirellulaceae bacterium]